MSHILPDSKGSASVNTASMKCDEVLFNGQYYKKEILKSGLSKPNSLSYQKNTNTLFFSYGLPEHNAVAAFLNLNTKYFKNTHIGGTMTAINPNNDDVYFGSRNGIYKYNADTETADLYTAKDVNIAFLYYGNYLFYITHPELGIYRFDDFDNSTRMITKTSDITTYIKDDTGFYIIRRDFTQFYRAFPESPGSAAPALYPAPEENFTYGGFARDANENIFVFGNNGVYKTNMTEKTLEKVADINNVLGLTFDINNNVIYSDKEEIVKLTRIVN